MDVLSSMTITEIGSMLVGSWILVDIMITLYNITTNTGPAGCATEGWHTWGFISWFLKGPCDDGPKNDSCSDLGRWKKYASKDNDGNPLNHLCHNQVNKVYEDAVAHNIVKGYNSTQLIAYVIVPTITVLSILYGLLSTTMNKGEWTFWIIIATIIFSGLSSISYDTDASIIPTHESPLEYITSKLKLGTADELEYSFISRKQNGDECLIKGTVLGESAITPSDQPTSYSGDCTESDVPL
jgi:hypothetical protein